MMKPRATSNRYTLIIAAIGWTSQHQPQGRVDQHRFALLVNDLVARADQPAPLGRGAAFRDFDDHRNGVAGDDRRLYVELCVQECGLGVEWTRAPRLPLAGAERKQILKIIHQGIANRPKLPKRR